MTAHPPSSAAPHAAHPPNRLAGESSPYLLQHAHNPVDWFPWGPEAFAEARRRGVPIFLSIGYSTCYWCHVMERESFENEEIGRLLSARFVCVKVDREERPDVDDVYMAATQMMSGHGGWPMSVFLEPEGLRPFWCGTYFPPKPSLGRPGFPQIIEAMSEGWSSRRDKVLEQAGAVAEAVREHLAQRARPVGLTLEHVSKAAQTLLRMLDRVHGGFGSAPKFPQPVFVELLMDVRDRAGDEATREAIDHAVRLTLDAMAVGGIHDQAAGGFHRYSVDETWTVPHFEKMLYDNAQLIPLYARAAATYGDAYSRRVAVSAIRYVLREMTADGTPKPGWGAYDAPGTPPPAHGGFFSAQDAEVGGREGANVVWTPEGAGAALPAEIAAEAMELLGLSGPANFRDPHHPGEPPTHIPRLTDRPDRLAERLGKSGAHVAGVLERAAAALYESRLKRPAPRLDDKVLASWNGMMIAGLARAARLLGPGEPVAAQGLAAATRAMACVLENLEDPRLGLLRSMRGGPGRIAGFLEDYACVAQGLLELHDAGVRTIAVRGASRQTLAEARRLTADAERLFGDGSGGFHDAREAGAELFVRPRSTHDGAIPSASSVMAHNLVTLAERSGEAADLERAVGALAAVSADVARSPVGCANSTRVLLRLIAAGEAQAERVAALGPVDGAEDDAAEDDFTPVEIYANAERVTVGKDSPAVVRLVLRVAPGYHVNAAVPRPGAADPTGGLVPLRVRVTGGTGVTVSAEYPEGTPFGPGGELRVHEGEIEFRLLIEREGEWSGRPLLAVTFQACTETECLAPRTAELDVAIDRGD